MFGKLKDKLKGALSVFSKKVDEEADETIEEEPPKVEETKQSKRPKAERKEEPKKEIPNKKNATKGKSASEKKNTKDKPKKELEIEKPIKEEVEQVEILSEPKTTKENVDPIKDNTSDAIAKKEKAIHQEAKDLEKEIELEKDKKAVEEISEPSIKEEALVEITHEEEDLEKDIQAQEEIIKDIEKPEKKKGFFGKLFTKKEEVKEEKYKEVTEPVEETVKKELEVKEPKVEEKKGLFSKVSDVITKKKISNEKFEELFQELEIILLENNTSFEVVEKIKEDLSKDIVDKPLPRNEIDNIILSSLKKSIASLFDVEELDLLKETENKKPLVISFIGVNGSGKTTQLAKVAKYFQNNNKSVVMAAGDTFRAAAIQQLEEHAKNLDIKLIKHDYGADAAAVAYDAIEHAKAKDIDVVLIDTAGRLHSNSNLMDELKKVIRVAKPDLNIFVGESITGNDCIFQATEFGNAVDIDGIILTKADVDEKGGTAISISYMTNKPIMFLGNGQGYEDLEVFDKEKLLKNLGL